MTIQETLSIDNIPTDSLQEITTKSRSNFLISFIFLSKEKRKGITDFYAFSRMVDDAVDDHPPEEGKKLLEFYRQEISRCYGGTPSHPLIKNLQQTLQRFKIPKKYPELLIEGCEMDLQKNRYANFEELYQYCYRVAGVIGLSCMKIFGLEGKEAEQSAIDLGLALQLTNILRDIREDAERGRIYLTQEDLKKFNVTEEEILSGKMKPHFIPLLKLQANRAESYYQKAFTAMEKIPKRPLLAAWMMGKTYHQILQTIRQKNYDVFSDRIQLKKIKKFIVVLKTLVIN